MSMNDDITDADRAEWMAEVQDTTEQWRQETLEGEPTLETQTAHTAVEAAEVLDILVKGETYVAADVDPERTVRRASDETVKELGDVVVAHLGTMSMLGVDAGAYFLENRGAKSGGTPLECAINTLDFATDIAQYVRHTEPGEKRAQMLCYGLLGLNEHTMDTVGVRMTDCVAAALEKNGARAWDEHQDEATHD